MSSQAVRSAVFQFHKGTIKPVFRGRTRYDEKTFQFHKGTIKPFLQILLLKTLLYFNSIKVRLNLLKTSLPRVLLFPFQFHKGTIKPVM